MAESQGWKGVWEKEERGLGVKSLFCLDGKADFPGKFHKTIWHHAVSIQVYGNKFQMSLVCSQMIFSRIL